MESSILISPRRIRPPEDFFPDKRRKITPSPECSLPKTFLVISPFSPIQPQSLIAPPDFPPPFAADLFPGCEATVASSSQVAPTSYPRQIILPYNLRQAPSVFFYDDNFSLLWSIFPGTQRVEFDERILVFHLDQLPAKPWPKKIAGVPCYLTTDPNDPGPTIPLRFRSHSRVKVADNLDLRNNETSVDLIFDLICDFFAKTNISITEIQFWGHLVIIVLENELNKDEILQAVPRSVARCNCFYLFESMMGRPRKPAARQFKPASSTRIDDSRYESLRPGVMLSSGKYPEEGYEIRTSSGVLVRDQLGFQYMTVAAHGFPGPPFDGHVYHPQGSCTAIGEVIVELSHTDVALVKLTQDLEFANEPFENTLMPKPPSQLTGFIRAAQTKIGDDIFLDSPFCGFVEGTRGVHARLRIPADDPHEPKQTWIKCHWEYMGQDSHQVMADGVCGSAIWDSENRVLGFFRYAPHSGAFMDWCMTVAADHLLDGGYSMV